MKKKAALTSPALIILDMISEFRFPGARPVLTAAGAIAPAIARLRARARAAHVPIIYVNDMPEDWESDQSALMKRCTAPGARGRDVVRLVAPEQGDFFIHKPRHSGFYATALAELLYALDSKELIITGTTSHQCVLFTAMDAHVRGYPLIAPRDCIAAPSADQTRHALFILQDALRTRTPLAASLRFSHP